mmetsp:Transcript_18277/g.45491  ORF Transcript_18277/g.45491 Transcript_18277/m.45491 type:complete len:253 (-) Transcript_18277:60-818(-)
MLPLVHLCGSNPHRCKIGRRLCSPPPAKRDSRLYATPCTRAVSSTTAASDVPYPHAGRVPPSANCANADSAASKLRPPLSTSCCVILVSAVKYAESCGFFTGLTSALNEASSRYPSLAFTLMAAICTTSRASPGPRHRRWCAPSHVVYSVSHSTSTPAPELSALSPPGNASEPPLRSSVRPCKLYARSSNGAWRCPAYERQSTMSADARVRAATPARAMTGRAARTSPKRLAALRRVPKRVPARSRGALQGG